MTHELRRLRIRELSAVDRPANRRRFLIVKREQGNQVEKRRIPHRVGQFMRAIGKAVGWTDDQIARAEHEAESFDDMLARRRIGRVMGALFEHHGALIETLDSIARSDEGQTPDLVREAIGSYLDSVKRELGGIIEDAFAKAEGTEALAAFDDVRKTISDLFGPEATMTKDNKGEKFDLTLVDEKSRSMVETELTRLQGEIDGLKKTAAPPAPSGPDLSQVPEALRKHYEGLAARTKASEDRAVKAEEIATGERVRRERAERVVLAKIDYPNLATDFEKLGGALHALEGKVEAGVIQEIQTALKAASTQIQTANLYAETGHSAPASDASAEGRIAKAAAELRKADPKLTAEAADVKALEEHPEWYAQYTSEHDARALAASTAGR